MTMTTCSISISEEFCSGAWIYFPTLATEPVLQMISHPQRIHHSTRVGLPAPDSKRRSSDPLHTNDPPRARQSRSSADTFEGTGRIEAPGPKAPHPPERRSLFIHHNVLLTRLCLGLIDGLGCGLQQTRAIYRWRGNFGEVSLCRRIEGFASSMVIRASRPNADRARATASMWAAP